HLQPTKAVADLHRPCRATVDGLSIVVIPCDRELSDAQREGTDSRSFFRALRRRLQHGPLEHAPQADQPRLITTWSDGENGGWFRQMHEPSGFFGHFFAPFMEEIETGRSGVRPIFISDFIARSPPVEEAWVRTGFRTPGAGLDVSQGTASPARTEAVEHIHALSARYRNLASNTEGFSAEDRKLLDEARTLVLEAETSCFVSWGEEWLAKLYDRTRRAETLLDKAETRRSNGQA
ncbi:MAG: glycoside hydrolase family 57, partial [Nitrospira sp.]